MMIFLRIVSRWKPLLCLALAVMMLLTASAFAGPYTKGPTSPETSDAVVGTSAQGGFLLEIEKTRFAPHEPIRVRFVASPHWPTNAWVGIIPSNVSHGSEDVNDQHDISYHYLEKRASGWLEFRAPGKPGSFDFRMHNTDNNGREMAYVTFQVIMQSDATMQLEKYTFSPGETIRVRYSAPPHLPRTAWIGIIPSHIPHGSEEQNDEHDIEYKYLEGIPASTLVFNAPLEPGSYDFRMHDTDDNGRELWSVTFKVAY